MRKLVSYIFIIILLVGVFTPFSSAYAQANLPSVTIPLNPLSENSTQNNLIQGASTPQPGSCDPIFCQNILAAIQEIIYWILQIMSLFIWLAGSVLDEVLSFTIVKFADNISKMDGIQVAWILVRDLMNLAFVFLLLYQGLRMILGRSNNAKNVIFGIVLASILINFSLFITKVIIDASNIVTVGFYNAIVESSQITEINSTSNDSNASRTLKKGLSGAYVNALGVNSFYSKDALPSLTANNRVSLIIIMLAGSILFLMVSVIFFVMAIMFLIRYAVLIVLMMLSPLAVMGIAIPKVQSLQKKWWDALLGQSLFGPAYMIMTWIILTLISSEGFNPLANQNSNWTKLFLGGEVDSIGLIINFIVVIVLTIMSLAIAKEQANKGGIKMSEWTTKATTFAGGAVMGGAAVAGRNVIGRGADMLSKNEKLQNSAAKGGFFAKNTLKLADRTATSSFDVRATKLAGQAKSTLGVDFGKIDPKKSNLRAIQKDKAEKEAKFAELLKPKEDLYDEAKAKDKEEKDRLKDLMDASQERKKTSDTELKDTEKKISKLKEGISEREKTDFEKVSAEEEVRIRKEITDMKKQTEEEEKVLKNLKETAEKNTEEFNKAKKAHDDYKSKEEDVIKNIYKDRVNTYANAIEDESTMSLFAKNLLLKIPTGGLIGGSTGHTKGDNKIIARKIRGVIKENKKVTKKSLKELGINLSDDEDTDNSEKTEAKKEEPKKDESSDSKTT